MQTAPDAAQVSMPNAAVMHVPRKRPADVTNARMERAKRGRVVKTHCRPDNSRPFLLTGLPVYPADLAHGTAPDGPDKRPHIDAEAHALEHVHGITRCGVLHAGRTIDVASKSSAKNRRRR
jgi:hypothetical protein